MPDKTIPVSCNKDCGGGCPLLATVRDGRVTGIVNNPLGGPYLTGCVKGFQGARAQYSPGRITKPLIRRGPRGTGEFKEVSWTEALDYTAGRLAEIKERHGNQAILRLGGSGSCRGVLHNTTTLAKRFLYMFGGCTEAVGNYSNGAASFTLPYILGRTPAGIDAGTLKDSNLIILWGANPADARNGGDTEAHLRQARERGVEIIVIDPRRSATAKNFGTQWIPIRPGTDVALMMAVLYVLIEENLVDMPFVARTSVGFNALADAVMTGSEPKTPQWAETVCGVPAPTILQLARQYGQTRPAALIPGYSIQRTIGGEEATRMAVTLQVATGNLGIPGGSSGSPIWNRLPFPRIERMGVPANPVKTTIPEYCWPDAILEGGSAIYPTQIKAIYNVGGNFLVQGSDLHKNIHAFNRVEFSVCHDNTLTPTARYCDVVLPATTFLERDDILFPSSGNYLLFSNKAVDPPPEARDDYDIFCGLAERLGFLAKFSRNRSAGEWLDKFAAKSEIPDVEEFKRTGIYFAADQTRIGLADFVDDPRAHPLTTPSGRVEIASRAFAKTGFSPIPTCRVMEDDEQFPLRLVTPHARFRIHSQLDDIPWFKAQETQALWMNPGDAAERGIQDARVVALSSPQGQMRVPVRITGDIMPGVVCLTEGAWPEFDEDGIETAGSANVLTSTEPTLPSQCSRTHSVLVQVGRI